MTFRQAYWSEPLLKELTRDGRIGIHTPPMSREIVRKVGKSETLVPKKLRREILSLPSLSEPQVVRHFVRLSQMNFGVDCGMFPLGSCTMKYNPKISERLARNSGLTRAHPHQPEESVQGILQILYDLSRMLSDITGTHKVSLVPAAGAHGEFVGALIMKSYIQDKGELGTRNEMLVPDSAHGTNPASAAMAGFRVVKVASNKEGQVDIDSVKKKVSERTAGMMLTVPNTLGLFERNILEVTDLVHQAGGLMYYDGANMNALLGRVRPGDMGFDIVHINVHKTFSTPHGGGGPGAGPVGVVSKIARYLPIPTIERGRTGYYLNYDLPKSIGRIKGFHGNIAVLLRAYVYISMLGADGLRKVSEQSVLASNYLLKKLDSDAYSLPYAQSTPRKHEFVVSCQPLKNKVEVRAMDIAKSLLDEGVHAPTTYFPLIVDEALMVEPTETEPFENLDRYAGILNGIASVARSDPTSRSKIMQAPSNTSVGKLDEVKASHPATMALNWHKIAKP